MRFRVFLVSNIYGKPFVPQTRSGNEKPRQRLGFSGTYFLMHHSGSGDVTRTHDTPGMKACGDGVPQTPTLKALETSVFPCAAPVCVECSRGRSSSFMMNG